MLTVGVVGSFVPRSVSTVAGLTIVPACADATTPSAISELAAQQHRLGSDLIEQTSLAKT
jgi:hypothetical protein